MRQDKDRAAKWIIFGEVRPTSGSTRPVGESRLSLRESSGQTFGERKATFRAGLMAVAQILAGLAYPDRRFLNLFGGAEAMIESPVLDEVVALVEKRTTERVTKRVTEQVTRDVALRAHVESVLDILADRFGAVPEDVQAKLAAITDVTRLRALVRLAATCPDLAAFAAQL